MCEWWGCRIGLELELLVGEKRSRDDMSLTVTYHTSQSHPVALTDFNILRWTHLLQPILSWNGPWGQNLQKIPSRGYNGSDKNAGNWWYCGCREDDWWSDVEWELLGAGRWQLGFTQDPQFRLAAPLLSGSGGERGNGEAVNNATLI